MMKGQPNKAPAAGGGASATSIAGARLETIQLLRAFAVIAVMLSHAGHEVSLQFERLGTTLKDPFLFGNFGVDLFFVISGFIMVHTTWNQFGQPGAAVDFMRRRLIRIMPLYWMATTAMILIVIAWPAVVHTATSDIGQWISSYLLLPYAREGDGLIRPVLGLGWSLEYEMFFYMIFALALFLPRAGGIVFAAIAMTMSVVIFGTFQETTIGQFLSHPIMLEFVAGILLGTLYRTGVRITRGTGVVLVLAACWMLYTVPDYNLQVDMARQIHYGIPSILLVSAAALSGDDALRNVFAPGVLAGEISYSAYLSHPFLVGGLGYVFFHSKLVSMMEPGLLLAVFTLFVVAGGLGLAWLVHVLVDMPITQWLRRISRPKPDGFPTAPAT